MANFTFEIKTLFMTINELLTLTLVILSLALWFWAMLDITRSRYKDNTVRLFWFAIVLIFPMLGSLIYFSFKRKITLRGKRKFNPEF
ncbi:PLD nuclease N-terminal domain-containing protein [Mangrovivirga sp. M17]|uniref:PLD nuclease N-terminal domain-containing protein n=1 Tax=Mangrovivirga halotolerans TaxID=2993936 RepID=A0ABT3RUN8_9BACT|nr:PLD nuclease N-terminal domain-containing protein [Mangrovivirga halotolerans]MCX2745366.1 PLD nuclease N-terminal domain-containing protein [Mangrovivirga halotolerans]